MTKSEDLPFPRHLKRAFLIFRCTAEAQRHSEGRDEFTAKRLAEALEMPLDIAHQAIERLSELGCIEVASVSPKSTVYRFALGSEMPAECLDDRDPRKPVAPRGARKFTGRR